MAGAGRLGWGYSTQLPSTEGLQEEEGDKKLAGVTGETGLEYDLQILIFLFVLQQFHLKGHQTVRTVTHTAALTQHFPGTLSLTFYR